MLHFACPHCHTPHHAPEQAAGKKSTCPACGHKLRLPALPVPTAVLAPNLAPVAVVAPPEPVAGVVEIPRPRRSRWRRQLTMLAMLLILLLAGWGGYAWWTRSPVGAVPESRSGARCWEERLVRDYILEHAPDPGSVEFVRWGPHDLQGELGYRWTQPLTLGVGSGFGQAGAHPVAKIVRVCYRGRGPHGQAFCDQLWVIADGKVAGMLLVMAGMAMPMPGLVAVPSLPMGDGWKEHFPRGGGLLDGTDGKTHIKLTVDKDKLQADEKKVLDKVRPGTDKATAPAEKSGDQAKPPP
jgi:hypothetical protein